MTDSSRGVRPLALSGPMGAGKSTVARIVASRTGARLVDVDAEIARRAGASVRELFARDGEAAFRAHEAAVVEEALAAGDACVLALGGGAVTRVPLRRLLLERAIVVTLDAPPETLWSRIGDPGSRPLLAGSTSPVETLRALCAARKSGYSECHAWIDTAAAGVEAVADAVCAAWTRDAVVMPLGLRSYRVEVGAGVRARLPAVLQDLGVRPGNVLVVTDDRVGPLSASRRRDALGPWAEAPEVVLPNGEVHKTLDAVSRIWDAALDAGLDRQGVLVAWGGGVVGDLTGFAAATLLRGVPCVQVPTTVLAMVDASVGGKTGFDRPQGKNLVGAFHQPSAVIADVDLLETLPDRSFRAGLAEVVKIALVADAALLAWLETHAAALLARDTTVVRAAVRWSVALKARIVADDEHETTGARASLNFGHTLGHGLEAASQYAIEHGEAVAMGLMAALRLGVAFGRTDADLVPRAAALLRALGLPVDASPQALSAALPFVAADKKRAGGRVRFVLCPRAGEAILEPLTTDQVRGALHLS